MKAQPRIARRRTRTASLRPRTAWRLPRDLRRTNPCAVEDYFPRLLDFAHATAWGKQPLPTPHHSTRCQARSLRPAHFLQRPNPT
ncbi:MAG: hypothetical protein ACLP8S_07360, partial [Solirubrobacteraceae bacterium]